MRLICAMPVGPGEADRHLKRALQSARQWADCLLVYGDAPDPATRNLIGSYAHVGRIHDEPLYEHGEHLVRNQLLELVDAHAVEGDLVVMLDADEEFHASRRRVRDTLHALTNDPRTSFNVRFLHLWTPDGTMHRVDGLWPSAGTRIYRHRKGFRVWPLHPSGWVCPPIPSQLCGPAGPPVLDVLHWSYARLEDRAPKHERYSRLPGHHPAHVASIIEQATLAPVPPR